MSEYLHKTLEVSMQSQSRPHMRVMRGKALYDEEVEDLKFVENEPRGPRSKEIGRTLHGRYVRRPDGEYTITLRVTGRERWLSPMLQAEICDIAERIEADRKKQDQENKKRQTESKNR